jgi:hypothetical protein
MPIQRDSEEAMCPWSRLYARSLPAPLLVGALFGIVTVDPVFAHGFAGKRFFPATLATDDPFVADELSLPTISYQKVPGDSGGPATRETDFAIDVSKRVTENFGIGFGATWKQVRPEEGDSQHGFDNLAASFKYKFYQSNEHETILSAGVDWDIGNTGAKRVGAESFSTITPTLFFGKGFGDLPDDMKFLRPIAVTGLVGIGIPSRSSTTTVSDEGDVDVERHPHTLAWGFALQYSIPYLNANVQGTGWSEPFNQLIPVVEFAMTTALDRGASGTTGTVNPGLIWAGRYIQLSAEAVIPINRKSGNSVGWIAQIHFFLDDLFPTTIGRPIFAN